MYLRLAYFYPIGLDSSTSHVYVELPRSRALHMRSACTLYSVIADIGIVQALLWRVMTAWDAAANTITTHKTDMMQRLGYVSGIVDCTW